MTKRNYITLLLLALLFAAPSFTAYLFYRHPQWLGSTTNKGQLLNPAILVNELEDGKQTWRFILWYPHPCRVDCMKLVDKLARIRLALGRHLYEVEQWLLLSTEHQLMSKRATQVLFEQDIHITHLSPNSISNLPFANDKPKIFIATPKGYLILAYDQNVNPGDIYHDIKRLLSTEKKSG